MPSFSITTWIMIGMGVVIAVLLIGLRVQTGRLHNEQTNHQTTKLEYANYRSASEARGTALFKASETASAAVDASYQKMVKELSDRTAQQRKLINENKTLRDRLVSAEFVSLFNNTGNRSKPASKEVTKEASSGTNEASPGVAEGQRTERDVLLTVETNKENYYKCKAQVEGLQQWVLDVCEVAGCE